VNGYALIVYGQNFIVMVLFGFAHRIRLAGASPAKARGMAMQNSFLVAEQISLILRANRKFAVVGV
jgi:hypothetical protein